MRAHIAHRAGDGRLMVFRTQADAKVHGAAEAVEIPTSPPRAAIDWINGLLERERDEQAARMPRDPAPAGIRLAERICEPRSMGAGDVLARMDGGDQVDYIAGLIMTSEGHVLRRFAGAVALAFTRLEGRLPK